MAETAGRTYSEIMIGFPGQAFFNEGTTVLKTKSPAWADLTLPSKKALRQLLSWGIYSR
jgi:hypothetical protein